MLVSLAKFVVKAEQDLPGTEWRSGGDVGGRVQRGEMTQKVYATCE
jgi:hypothetical protein